MDDLAKLAERVAYLEDHFQALEHALKSFKDEHGPLFARIDKRLNKIEKGDPTQFIGRPQ